MELHDRQKRGEGASEAPAQKPVEPAQESAAQQVAECKGDPALFAKLVKQASAAQLPEIIAAAQRLYGNAFVHEALDPAGPAKHTNVTAGHTGTPNHTGVRGLEGGAPDMFAEQQDAKHAKNAEGPRVFGAELEGRHSDTFGAERMSGGESTHMGGQYNKWGGNGMPGFNNHQGEAGMFANTAKTGGAASTVTTPTPGGPVPIPYPNLADVPAKTDTAGPTKGPDSPTGRTNGDEAGVRNAATSSSVMGAAKAVNGAFDVNVEDAPAKSPMLTTTTPREDQDAGGGMPVVLNRADGGQVANALHREMAGQVGHAGSKGDGAGDTGNVAGTSASSGMVASQRDKVGGRDLPHESGGNLDLDAALKLNNVVNPTRG